MDSSLEDGRVLSEWRRVPISPYRAYEVSSDGRIRRGGKELSCPVDKEGYSSVLLYYSGLRKRFRLHRLICEAFHGPPPEGSDCAHGDGNPRNNRSDNLRWASRSENMMDASRHGTLRHFEHGENHPHAKLTMSMVDEIRGSSEPHRTIARRLPVSESTVRKIRKGDRW